jgi:ribosomal protein L18
MMINNINKTNKHLLPQIINKTNKHLLPQIINKTNKHLLPQITEHKKDYDIWHWKLRSWLRTASKMGSQCTGYWT